MSEIKDMYNRHPSIKSIKLITVISRRVVSIDLYRMIDTIDNVHVIDIDSYRFIEQFSDIDVYRLPTSGLSGQTPVNTLAICIVFFHRMVPFKHGIPGSHL